MRMKTHKDDVERLALSNPALERVDRDGTVVRDLDHVAVLLEDLHGQLLVDHVVLGEQDVERDVVGGEDRVLRIRLQRGYQGRREILDGYWRSDLRADAVVQAPFDCCYVSGRVCTCDYYMAHDSASVVRDQGGQWVCSAGARIRERPRSAGMISDVVKTLLDTTYDSKRVGDDGVDVRALVLVGDLCYGRRHMRLQAQQPDLLRNVGPVAERVHVQDRPLRERLHLGQGRLQGAVADLRRDREVELAALRHLTLHPHVTLHEGDEALRDRQTQTSTTVLLHACE